MESARDAALAPFRAQRRATADADRYLQRVASYIEQLGNEEEGEWELGDWFERNELAADIKRKLRPPLIKKLIEERPSEGQIHKFIEERTEQELQLED